MSCRRKCMMGSQRGGIKCNAWASAWDGWSHSGAGMQYPALLSSVGGGASRRGTGIVCTGAGRTWRQGGAGAPGYG
eukprot:465222-Alexandrium_andersonii.AAC.1